MDSRLAAVNRVVKRYDSHLVAQRERNGAIHIYRKTSASAVPHFVFALTENWGPGTAPVEWGLEVIRNRLVAHDLWNNDNIANQVIRDAEKRSESKERALKNTIESFLLDFRRQFGKTFNDVNTSSLAKIDRRALKGA